MMFKATFLASLISGLPLISASAQAPDPRDSVILESKTLDTGLVGSPAFVLNVYITNKDSLTYLTLPLAEKTELGSAYMIVSRPRTFTGVVIPLTYTLYSYPTTDFSRYNSSSGDTFLVGAGFDSLNLTTVEPPNAIRKAFWQIKFDSVVGDCGQTVLDSAFLPPDTSVEFINMVGAKVKVHFLRGFLSVCSGDTFPTSINGERLGRMPSAYTLSQNYPNPFNANTQITFALPKSGHATLAVFNLLGQRVSTLVDGYLTAGTKIVNWDGRDDKGLPVPSGVYFYQLHSGEFKATKKMLVLK